MTLCKYCGESCTDGNVCQTCADKLSSLKRKGVAEPDNIRSRWMGYLSYIPFCFLITAKYADRSPFARFHARRGLIFTLATIAAAAVCVVLYLLFDILSPSFVIIPNTVTGIILLVWTVVFTYLAASSPRKRQ